MRKFNFCFLLLVLIATVARAQRPAGPAYLGTKTPYIVPDGGYTAPPSGFRPVFVNYTGRHGARYLTKAGADLGVLQVLETASNAHGLTPVGSRVLEAVRRLCLIEKGQYENITLLGASEQHGIGQRMLDRYPGVFTGKGMEA